MTPRLLRSRWLLALGWAALIVATPRQALAEGLFQSKNGDVEHGNERLAAKDAKGALEAYDRAARALPGEGAVHLNRGLALMAQGKLDQAREALRLSTEPPAAPAVRADAYYDLGVAFYRQAEAQLSEQKDEDAQQAFREASDAFRKSLRMRPGSPDAAWNYELAQRRIVELKKKQEEKQKQEQQQNKDQPPQDQQDQQDQPQDPAQQGDQNQQQQDQKQEQGKKPEAKPEEPQPEEPSAPETADKKLPHDVARALDALDQGEKNLQRARALQQAGQRRPPEKDW